MKLEDKRAETPFAARDNMLDIWTHVTELCFRGFGKKKRKMSKEPRNFSEWSEESRNKWCIRQEENVKHQEYFDNLFISRETAVLDNLCRQIVYNIDGANELKPQYVFECDMQMKMQDDAIKICCNMKRELNHIIVSIPSNKNFIVKLQEDIDTEIKILRGWRQSYNAIRKKAIENEINQRMNVADKIGFIFCLDKEAESQ